MNNEIRIIRRDQEQPSHTKPQNVKKEVITQNSPIIKQLKEAEEKHRIRRELSDDELIELEFKEVADKIRLANKTMENTNKSDDKISNEIVESSDLESLDSQNVKKDLIAKELPIDDKNLAYIRDLDEPMPCNFNEDDGLQIRIKTAENAESKTNHILHREPLRREVLNRFGSSDTSKDIEVIEKVSSDIDADLLNKQISNPISGENSNISLIERLQMDREKINEAKKDEIKKVESSIVLRDDTHIDLNEQDKPMDFTDEMILSNYADGFMNSQNDISQNDLEYESQELSCVASTLSIESIVGDLDLNTPNDNAESFAYTQNPAESIESNDKIESSENIDSQVYKLPHTGLLTEPKYQKIDIDGSEIDLKAHNLISKLRVFRINGDITDIYSGPVVTTFEFRPAPDVKVSRIQNLENDLSMTLKARSIRIQAPIPGKDVVGIEIPNNTIQTIYIREVFESPEFVNSNAHLAIALGKDIIGKPVVSDLAKLPHLLIAGTTGSGKSVGLNGMILSLLYRNTPEQLRFIMIDPKRVELSLYKDIPHLLTPIIADPKKAVIALSKAVDEMNRRYEIMNEVGVKNIIGYNEVAEERGFDKLPYIVIIIDEFADLMIMGGKDSEQYLTSLASKARASGIHLIIATQRPTVNVVTGLIKSNLPSRISYRVGSPMDSKVVLDKVGAETLLGNGDMLFSDKNVISRFHAPYSNEKEIERVADFIRSQRSVEYDEFFSLEPKESIPSTSTSAAPISEDEYMEKAKEIILSSGRTSASYLQRMLGVGFNRASNILETLEKEGFLSAPNSKNIREIVGYNKAI